LQPEDTSQGAAIQPGGAYARLVLGVLVVVYVFNFLDRQILSILAERIKADLQVTDAQIGYLYGTAFAVFYAVFGIPLGRLADVWDRRRLIALGLAFWSVMTAVSGLARSFVHLALARIGVGVGEASATPAAYSILSDCFPPWRRATALAVYSSGIYIGSGLGLGLGGLVVDRWEAAWAGGLPPFGLRGWQAAFLVVGLPGLLLAFGVGLLREPVRGQADGIPSPATRQPFREFGQELMAVLPLLTLVRLHGLGAGAGGLAFNLGLGALLAGTAHLLSLALGTPAQWWSLVLGLYAAASWAQSLALRDPPAFALIFRTPALHFSNLGFAFLSFNGYALGFWIAPFFVRVHGMPASRVGLLVGGAAAAGGWLGVTLGGVLGDRLRLLGVKSPSLALALSVPVYLATALWLGPGASTVQDLVLPRMRAVASAAFLLVVTLVGLAMGPYTVGRLSMLTGDLRLAMTLALAANLVGFVFLWLASRGVPRAEADKRERARLAGEPWPAEAASSA
jgi:MFS family permease